MKTAFDTVGHPAVTAPMQFSIMETNFYEISSKIVFLLQNVSKWKMLNLLTNSCIPQFWALFGYQIMKVKFCLNRNTVRVSILMRDSECSATYKCKRGRS